MTKLKKTYYTIGAMMTLGMTTVIPNIAWAQAAAAPAGNNFSKIASNITTSISDLPGLLSAVSYMIGIGLGVLGIIKIKGHVENPGQQALKDGVIRLAAGGALFALPIVYEAMLSTIGQEGTTVGAAELNPVKLKLLE